METRRTSVVVIGAGPAGLAMSACLARYGIDHVVLERGQAGHAWRTQRWDSLRLLTPNWMTDLPGLTGPAGDPDGFLAAAELVALLDHYRERLDLPVIEHTAVRSLHAVEGGFTVATSDGPWHSQAVVVATGATGATGAPRLPDAARLLPTRVRQIPALAYRNPAEVGPGGVLVVGAAASGVQIADELRRAGRDVVIAAGDHVRLPRTYRGRDIYWWMDRIGLLDERHDQVPDLERARRLPSAQLVGSSERRSLDLGTLAAAGVTVVGRFAGVAGRRVQFSGSLPNLVASAELKQARLLDRIDEFATRRGPEDVADSLDRPDPVRLPTPATELDRGRFQTVIWATGHRQHYPWLDAALLDRWGRVRHTGGVMAVPGLYVVGLPFLRHRRSGLLAGIGADAVALADHVAAHLGRIAPAA